MKSELRNKYLKVRNSIPDDKKEKSEIIIQKSFLESKEYKQADVIFTYVSMKSEVSTLEIINKAIEDGKIVAAPVSLKDREMYFVKISSTDNLKKSKFGVLEPMDDKSCEIKPNDKTVMIVPGVAFDENGHRMGYGGGYYDTYIEKHSIDKTVALAFEEQVHGEIPYEKHDKNMNVIITEKRIIGGERL